MKIIARPGPFARAKMLLVSLGLAAGLVAMAPRLSAQDAAAPDATALFQQGLDAGKKGDNDGAIAAFTQVLKLDPKNAKAFYGRGLAYQQKGDFDPAIADFSQVLQLSPNNALAYTARGLTYGRKGDLDHAIVDFSQAIVINSHSAPAFYNRGLAYQNKGQYDKAIADYKQTLQVDPNAAEAYNNLAWLLATCPQPELRDGKNAVVAATKACDLASWKNPNWLDTLAAACAEAGDFPNAVKWETQFLATPNLDPGDAADAQSRLALYQAHQPYHMAK